MRFDSLTTENWAHYAPYVDTVILPVALMTFKEKNLKTDAYRCITETATVLEKKLTGRVLLLPTVWHSRKEQVFEMKQDLSLSGFQHVVLLMHEDYKVDVLEGIEKIHTYIIQDAHMSAVEANAQDAFDQIVRFWGSEI